MEIVVSFRVYAFFTSLAVICTAIDIAINFVPHRTLCNYEHNVDDLMGIIKICTTFFQIQVTRMSLQRWPAYGNNKKGLWTPKVKTVTGGIQSKQTNFVDTPTSNYIFNKILPLK